LTIGLALTIIVVPIIIVALTLVTALLIGSIWIFAIDSGDEKLIVGRSD
jgi:uncharacterized membrane protein